MLRRQTEADKRPGEHRPDTGQDGFNNDPENVRFLQGMSFLRRLSPDCRIISKASSRESAKHILTQRPHVGAGVKKNHNLAVPKSAIFGNVAL